MRKDDPSAQALFDSALGYPSGYCRIEWCDRREGSLPQLHGQQLLGVARKLESIDQQKR